MASVKQLLVFVALVASSGVDATGPTVLQWQRDCPSGFDAVGTPGLGRVCLRLGLEWKSYAAASDFCHSYKATLAIVHSRAEYHRLVGFVRVAKSYNDQFFVGAQRLGSGLKNFLWMDGTWADRVETIAPWAAGEPNNWEGREGCLTIYPAWRSNTWNDLNCSHKIAFVCEYRL